MFRKTLNMILFSGALFGLVACNTVDGVGEDLQSASDTVENEM